MRICAVCVAKSLSTRPLAKMRDMALWCNAGIALSGRVEKFDYETFFLLQKDAA